MPRKKDELKAKASSTYPKEATQPAFEPEETFIKGLSFHGIGNFCAAAIDVKKGKVVRIRPLHYDWKYDPKEFNPWKMEVKGKVFKPMMKTLLPPLSLAYKKRVYSPNRIKYPLKRVDWDPNGERHPENRGKSKYKRISWDEALELVASEIKRIHQEYGPYGVLLQGDGHAETKTIHAPHGCHSLLMSKMGGFTQQVRNPDSWEGWYWGGKHMWGMETLGLMLPQGNIHLDVSKNTQMILYWGCDPEVTPWYRSGQAASRFAYWFGELGIKCVYICPDLNYGAGVHADKWIPILPNTDAALHLAIAYVWLTEGTYDKDYISTHTVGFDKFADYVMGKEDGIPKTPKWASQKCGVPTWTIKALARQWAAKATSTAHYCGGGKIRGAFSSEPTRLEIANLAMQGLGKPGVHQFTTINPFASPAPNPDTVLIDMMAAFRPKTTLFPHLSKQMIPKTLISKAITNPPVTFWGTGAIFAKTEDQFIKYTYPIPKEEGGTEIHMIWCDNPCLTTCWNDGNKSVEAFRNKKIECIVVQHPWLENDTLFADIILPVNTKFEEYDIGGDTGSMQYSLLFPEKKCIEPLGESKTDYEIVCEIAKKLGKYDEVTEGKTVDEWVKYAYEKSGVAHLVSWDDLNKKGYYVVPARSNWEGDLAGMIKFYEDPVKNPLSTPSGKIEFYSERLAKHFPDDKERPPSPKWIEKSDMHDERLSSERAKKYPLLAISNHGRWRVHAQCDDISWSREVRTCKIKGFDGYMYEPIWINPADAGKRGIQDGDIVKVFNERGTVLCGALVWERMMPGVISVDHGARVDYIIPGKLDRGGAINLISPIGITSKHAVGMATSGYLVEIEKVSMAQMEQWQKEYPEAFEREYDPASGLRFNAWVEGGMA